MVLQLVMTDNTVASILTHHRMVPKHIGHRTTVTFELLSVIPHPTAHKHICTHTPFQHLNPNSQFRVQLAIRRNENFKVIIILPAYPAGDLSATSTRYIIKHPRTLR
eukprot:TRINITY_DN2866_c0_g1_i3.p1 TRINITY_DN2866_c0_g1~~TRINITY_DN2866_c0_g1_i3.p1  ORF type:complete len:107 (-),score=9.58 TRINITY_DN2866_c0_g1_i3:36-356(-)